MWDSNLTAIWFDYKVDWKARLNKEGKALIEFLGTTSNKVLDLGCGTGRHAEFLANNGFTIWAADPGEAMIQYANEHIKHPKITFLKMDAYDLEDWDECPEFDRVLLIGNVIPHWHCRNELVANLLYYGISAIALDNTGSNEEGIRACVSFVKREQFPELEKRLILFNENFS